MTNLFQTDDVAGLQFSIIIISILLITGATYRVSFEINIA